MSTVEIQRSSHLLVHIYNTITINANVTAATGVFFWFLKHKGGMIFPI